MKKNHEANYTELEALSTYLDGQLLEQEAEAIRARLEIDPAFRAQLTALRQTRYTLRNAPKVKRPRSFVLSPEMVRKQKAAIFGMNFSRVISAAASVLLVVVLGGQFLLGGGRLGASSAPMDVAYDNAAEPEMMAQEELQAMEMEAPLAEAPMDETLGDSADDAAPAEAAAEEPAEEPAEEADPPTAEQTSEPGGGGGVPPSEEAEPVVEPTSTVTLEGETRSVPNQKDTPEEDLSSEPPEGDGGIMAMQITEESETALAEPLPTQPRFNLSPVGILQAVLLILAIGGGILAAYFRKRVR